MLNIMLVDDETIARKDLKSMLSKFSNEFRIVAEAGDGDDALSKFLQFRPDIVITDIKMPRMDGIKLAQHILSISKEIKVVLLSAYGEFHLAQQALQIGVSAYLIKHEIDPPLLLRTLTDLASQFRAEAATAKTDGILKLLQKSQENGEQELILKKFEGTIRNGSLYLVHFQIDQADFLQHTGTEQWTVFRMLDEALKRYLQASLPFEFVQKENEFILIMNLQQIHSSQEQTGMLTSIAKQMQREFKMNFNATLSAVVGGPVSHLDKIVDLYRKTLTLFDYRIFTQGEAVIFSNNLGPAVQVDITKYKDKFTQFKIDLEQDHLHAAKELLKTIS